MTSTDDHIDAAIVEAVSSFDPTGEALVALVENTRPLLLASDATYEQVRDGRLELFRARTAIERRRKELKEPSVRFGKAIDAEAKRLTALVEPTEDALHAREKAMLAERERLKREAELAEERRLAGIQADLRALGRIVATWELAAMNAEQIEELLTEARAEYEERQRQEAEARRIAEEQRKRDEEQRAAERAELERLRAELAERKAREAAVAKMVAPPVVDPAPAVATVPTPPPAAPAPVGSPGGPVWGAPNADRGRGADARGTVTARVGAYRRRGCLVSRLTAEERVRDFLQDAAPVNTGELFFEDAVKIAKEHAAFEVEHLERALEEAHTALAGAEYDETVALEQRDRYEDVIQEVHVALGGSGEWAARSGCDREEGETGDLCADVLVLAARVVRERDEARAEGARLLRSRDEAYTERNALVAALSKVFPASLEQHDPADTSWDPEWLTIVAIELPTGQATWHLHDRERGMFAHLRPRTGYAWDGHTTAEKYARIAALAPEAKEGG